MESKDLKKTESSEVLALSQAINHLSFNLYQVLSKEKSNVFFSPLSLSSALSMLLSGSKNATAKEMENVLGYEAAHIPNEKIGRCFQSLHSSLEENPGSYTLSSANVLFSQKGFPIKAEYKRMLEESYKAMALEVDFQRESQDAVKQANDWVRDKTNGMIPQLLDSLDPATVMVILNAVYFKGFWMQQFDKQGTFKQPFNNGGLKSKAKEVDMMHASEKFPFVERESFKALELSYRGDEISMLVLLPNSPGGLEELESQLSPQFIAELTAKLCKREVEVALPKFRLEYTKSLEPQLQRLGMKRIFQQGADFGVICESTDLKVSAVVHKAVIEVNEEGSEAAAATAVCVMFCSAPINPEFIVDHPFLFLIYNKKTDLVLFMGRVEEL